MLINYNDLLVGDEIIIPSNSNLKYLKILKKNEKSMKCSIQRNVATKEIDNGYTSGPVLYEETCQPDTTLHNDIFYLINSTNYVSMWLVNRD